MSRSNLLVGDYQVLLCLFQRVFNSLNVLINARDALILCLDNFMQLCYNRMQLLNLFVYLNNQNHSFLYILQSVVQLSCVLVLNHLLLDFLLLNQQTGNVHIHKTLCAFSFPQTLNVVHDCLLNQNFMFQLIERQLLNQVHDF